MRWGAWVLLLLLCAATPLRAEEATCDAVVLVEADGVQLARADLSSPVRLQARPDQTGQAAFSPDCRSLYLLSRDGWVSRYALPSGDVLGEVKAGQESAALALSADGKYLMVGNRRPGTLVSLDASNLSIIREMAVLDLKKHPSGIREVHTVAVRRVFLAALADSPELWEIPYTEDHEPIYNGFVHSREADMVEGFAEKGPFPARKLRYPAPLWDLIPVRDGQDMIARDPGKGRLHHLNLLSGTDFLQKDIPGGADLAHALRFDRQGREVLAVPLGEAPALALVDAKTLEEIGRVTLAAAHGRVAGPDAAGRLWLSFEGRDEIQLVDSATMAVGGTIRPSEGHTVIHVDMVAGGKTALAVLEGDGLVAVDTQSLKETARLPASGPRRAILAPRR
jgi:hypothetical protein